MNEKLKTPTLAEVKAAGYVVEVKHNRLTKIAYKDTVNGKIVVKVVDHKTHLDLINNFKIAELTDGFKINTELFISELLPKGGLTEIWVTDPDTSAEFYGFAKCSDKENYNKAVGVTKALERVMGLMLVLDGQDGFKMKLKC